MANPSRHSFLDEMGRGTLLAARRTAFLQGWPRLAVCVCAGALAALSQAPLYAVPGLIVGFALFVWVLDGLDETLTGYVQAFSAGWFFGAGYFLAALHWLWVPGVGAAAAPGGDMFAGLGFIGLLACAPALAALAAHLVWRPGPERVVILALFWAAAEWGRGHVFGGFPWGLLGYAWADTLPVLQVAAWVGIYGLSFLTLLFVLSFVAAVPNPTMTGWQKGWHAHIKSAVLWPLTGLGIFALVLGAGQWRLSAELPEAADSTHIWIVHSDPERCDLAKRASGTGGDPRQRQMLIVPGGDCWSAYLSEDQAELKSIGKSLAPNQLIVVQSKRRTRVNGAADRQWHVFETLHVVDSQGRIRATHDRRRNLPFGVDGTENHRDASGAGPRTFAPGIVPEFGAIQSVEAVYPGAVTDETRRPEWLLHVSDEVWLRAGGKRQALDHIRVRAIEEGLPIVRAVYRGYSAVIDAHGGIVRQAGPADSKNLEAHLPNRLPPTAFARFGDWGFLVLLVIAGLGVFLSARGRAIPIQAS